MAAVMTAEEIIEFATRTEGCDLLRATDRRQISEAPPGFLLST